MISKSQRVLLTGGAGFIGSHVAEALLRRGVQLWILDNLDIFYSPEWKRANLEDLRRAGTYEFADVDIRALALLRRHFESARPDIVIHLAARVGVSPSIEQPHLYEQVNVAGTLNLLEMCRQLKVRKFIFGSSSSVYGATSQLPFSENQVELRPISVYAATKLSGEMLCYTYAHLFALPVICLRFFSVYGPRQRPDLAIHKFTRLIEAGKPVPIFGDGSAGRDYTWVDDIVAGVMSAVDYEPQPDGGAPFEIFNLGNSHPVTLTEMAALLERITGRTAILKQNPLQPGYAPLTWADISKAGRLLDYRPAMRLEEGLARFVAWYRRVRIRSAAA